MKIAVKCIVASLGAAAIAAGAQTAPSESDAWMPIEGDPSRAQLFAEHLVKPIPPANGSAGSKALPGSFRFPDNAVSDDGHPRVNSIFGIDVSHWSSPDSDCKKPVDPQRDIDFNTLGRQHVYFVYVKASQDVRYRDCRFAEYWSALGKLHSASAPRRGTYHFLTATSAGLDQAKSFVRLRKENGGFDPREMPPVLDLEWDKTTTTADRWVSKTSDEIVGSALDWLAYVETTSGKRPMVYTSNEWLKEREISKEQLAKLRPYRIWTADYSQTHRAIEQPQQPQGLTWSLWQFSESARLTIGSSKAFDATIFKGTPVDFDAAMGIPAQ